MIAGPSGRSRLVKVVAMEPGFPFYGSFALNLKGKVADFENLLIHEKPLAWIYPELRTQLGLDLGDQIKLGEFKFRISDIVKEDSDCSSNLLNLRQRFSLAGIFLIKPIFFSKETPLFATIFSYCQMEPTPRLWAIRSVKL